MPTTRHTLADNAWTSLGAAPLTVQVEHGRVHVVVDTVAPSAANITAVPSLVIGDGSPDKSLDCGLVGQTVYARSRTGKTASIVVAR